MPELDQPTPDFTLSDLDGHPFALESARGRLVVLNFWSAECPWSVRTDALLAEWEQAWGDSVLVIRIACNAGESPELLCETAAGRGLAAARVLRDAQQQATDLYAALTTPHICVIDAAGRLRYQGGVDDVSFRQRQPTRFYLKEAVDALLAGGRPPLGETPAYGCAINRY